MPIQSSRKSSLALSWCFLNLLSCFFDLQNRLRALMHITCWLKPLSAAEKAPRKISSAKCRTLGIEAEAAPTHMHQCGTREFIPGFLEPQSPLAQS